MSEDVTESVSSESLSSQKSLDSKLERSASKTERRFYALYSYVAHRFHRSNQSQDSDKEKKEESSFELSVSDFLQAEATADGDFSLTIVSTNLSAEKETGLRKCLAHKISRGAVYSGTGSIIPLSLGAAEDSETFSCQMYFSLLRNLDQSSQESSSYKGVNSREFVVCFLTQPEDALDLFQKDLDRYSQGLLKLIDAECWESVKPEGKVAGSQLTEINTGIRDYLNTWYEVSIQYVWQCVSILQQATKYLIYCAMTGSTMRVEGEDAEKEALFHRFVECCSLTELLHSGPADKREASPVLVDLSDCTDVETTLPEKNVLVLRKGHNSYSCDKEDLPKFCEDWSDALAGGDNQTATSLKRIIESYKLKCIQDLNSLTRLIRLAETDFYALYRAYAFLKSCGNGKILLSYTKLEQQVTDSTEGANVLRALEDFLQDTGGLKS